jgi:hypothetical protein
MQRAPFRFRHLAFHDPAKYAFNRSLEGRTKVRSFGLLHFSSSFKCVVLLTSHLTHGWYELHRNSPATRKWLRAHWLEEIERI